MLGQTTTFQSQDIAEAALEIVAPDGTRKTVRIARTPFLIGRGSEAGNDLQLVDQRISRQCAALVYVSGGFQLQDRGQRRGLFVNGEKVDQHTLTDGDVITFGLADSYELIFHMSSDALPELLDQMEHITASDSSASGLAKLSQLLEAIAKLHSHMPLDSALSYMVDEAVKVTDADRGLLLVSAPGGAMRVRLARQSGGRPLPIEGLEPTQTAIRFALAQKRGIITEDLAQTDLDLKAAKSIIAQRLRSLVVIPLYTMVRSQTGASLSDSSLRGELLGILYLDSTRPSGFSQLERQVLDTLAMEAAGVLDNARLLERERERQRLEQEIGIAREIQQALLPREFRDCPYMNVTAINQSCLEVGGDYFDVIDLGNERTAFLIADVSGKGLGAALLTTMLQGALSGTAIGEKPGTLLSHVNKFLCSHSQIERYATLFFGILEPGGKLEYINAGHPSPVLLRGGRAEAPFDADSFPVGLIEEGEYKSSIVQLEPGDTLVLFSDGITEAMDPEENLFGTARLKETLERRTFETVDEVQSSVLQAVSEFARGARQADDLTLLIVRYLAAKQAAPASASGA